MRSLILYTKKPSLSRAFPKKVKIFLFFVNFRRLALNLPQSGAIGVKNREGRFVRRLRDDGKELSLHGRKGKAVGAQSHGIGKAAAVLAVSDKGMAT